MEAAASWKEVGPRAANERDMVDRQTHSRGGGGKEKSVLCGTALFFIHFKSSRTYRNMYLITDIPTLKQIFSIGDTWI